MLVEVARISPDPDDAAMVTLRTSVGTVPVRWGGSQEAAAGEHHVEWELDEEFQWGFNCLPAAVEEPRLSQDGRGVCCRGRLGLTGIEAAQPFAHLELAEAVIDLGQVDALPRGMAGAWVEIHLGPEKITIYPYQL